ncbi:transporter substrate-binding domain-containing protein [Leeia sp. TBRC 13508]|uniref:Transporter substrate-binding domain-containing protein n=1 Tax=Leeia speluncae TaxID=2884804 RepID=A0ABS8D3U4_9NEIS|nr:transporter substrate-binding domain-containing protein [Leeia speluncae]MCB6182666.1 transporter substrate-binding domain-containing protein [Leeia speluncae]
MKSIYRLTGLVVSLLTLGHVQAAGELRVMIGHGDGEPIVEYANPKTPNTLTGGVIHDLAMALGERLGMQVKFVEFSRKRVETSLRDGKAHLACNSNPDWYEHKEWFDWSRAVFDQVEAFVSLKDAAVRPDKESDLKGLRLGTIHGYGYPTLDKYFQDATKRVDETNVSGNFKKLKLKMIDAMISSRGEIGAFLRSQPKEEQQLYYVGKDNVTEMPTYCALSKNAPVKLKQLNDALGELKKSGQLAKIVKRYNLQESK